MIKWVYRNNFLVIVNESERTVYQLLLVGYITP
jgi:hypothetical protein